MASDWRTTSFVLCWTFLGPTILLVARIINIPLPLSLVSICGLIYTWGLVDIVKPFFFSPLRDLPSPPAESFLLGYNDDTTSRQPGIRLLELMKAVPNHGLIHFRGFAHSSSELLLTTPETLVEVLNNKAYDYHKPAPAKRFLSRVLGRGLIVVEDKEHKVQRKSVAPAFQGGHIRALVPIFWAKATEFADAVAQSMSPDPLHPERGVVEINSIAQRITLDIIGKAGLGRDFNTIRNSDDDLAQQYATILDPSDNPTLFFLVNAFLPPWLTRFIPWKEHQQVVSAIERLRAICRKMLAEKKAALAEKSVDQIDILSVLMRSGAFDDDDLMDSMLTFLAAGHETTSSALTWATYLLSMHSDIQEQLRDEIKKRLAEAGKRSLNASILDSIEYLSAVCEEVLRLYPPVPVTAREAIRETTIGEQVVPKGTFVIMVVWAINRLKSIWGPDAEVFHPDRWMGEGKTNFGGAGTAYGKITFLHGPRSCIGQGFAREEMKCLLAALVLRFRMELEKPEQAGKATPDGIVTIKPKGGMRLRLTKISE